MISFRFGPEDVATVRFAISPLMELHNSVRALDHPEAKSLHLPWVAATRERVADLDIGVLRALQRSRAYTPDFINPPPSSPLGNLEDELAEMLATPADQVRAEVRRVYAPAPLPPLLQPFDDDPPAAVAALAGLLRAYWSRALAPHWPRIRALLDGDILHRARQLADGGAQRLFADIHPELRFADDTLFIDMPFDGHLDLDGRGLLFVPSAFTWPRPAAAIEAPWQPFVVYPARGIASLWEPGRAAPPAALAALLGRRRASVLAALHAPRSTTELARALELSPGSVSQHLSVLRDAGLVNAHRVGRLVLYVRSPIGDGLIGQLRDATAPPTPPRPG
jgi:DNA-binding transcriptional ArsR family regulator